MNPAAATTPSSPSTAASITAIAPATDPPPTRSFILPALVNAHDHARPTASSFGAVNMPLESWILRSVFGTPPDPYLAAASALARSARSGCAAMMIHYTRPSGTMTDRRRGDARSPARRPMSAFAWRLRSPSATRTRSCMATARTFCLRSMRRTARRSRSCSCGLRQRRTTTSQRWKRSMRRSQARWSTCSSAPPACSGAQSRCSRRSPSDRPSPAAACTCICSRRSTSATGPTRLFPAASSDI